MKLLFDENLAPRLVREITDLWPESKHIEFVQLRGATDQAIWEYARAHDYAIVTKDDDFRALAFVRGTPPKVIWLQVGNTSTTSIATILRDSASEIAAFDADRVAALLVLGARRVDP